MDRATEPHLQSSNGITLSLSVGHTAGLGSQSRAGDDPLLDRVGELLESTGAAYGDRRLRELSQKTLALALAG